MNTYKLLVLCFSILAFTACEKEGSATTTKKATSNLNSVTVDTDSESEKFSYSIGMIIGNTLKNSGVDSLDYKVVDRAFGDDENEQIAYTITAREAQALIGEEVDMDKIDTKIIKRAIFDVFEGDTTLMTLPEVSQSYQGFMQSNQTRVAQANLDNGKKFLETNKAKEGVMVTDTGLQYELIQEGTGKMPEKNDLIEVWFSAKTLDNNEFKEDTEETSSYVDLKDGTSDIIALAEAVTLFPIGSEFNLYVPSNLAFGEARISPAIGPNSTIKVHVSKSALVDSDTATEYRRQKAEYIKQLRQQNQRR